MQVFPKSGAHFVWVAATCTSERDVGLPKTAISENGGSPAIGSFTLYTLSTSESTAENGDF